MIKGNQKGKGTAKQVASYVPKKNRCDVFLSYRRADGRDLTGRIKDKLALKLLSVFYDYDSLKDGKFNLKIIDFNFFIKGNFVFEFSFFVGFCREDICSCLRFSRTVRIK